MIKEVKWYNFKPYTPGNRQKLPAVKKYVLVRVKNTGSYPDPIVVGYLKYHAGVKSEPYFVTPGCNLENMVIGDENVIQWCDCLPENFKWYEISPTYLVMKKNNINDSPKSNRMHAYNLAE